LLLPQSESGRHGAYAVLRFVEQVDHQGPGGKIDFHAIRKAYINLVIESGVTVKEAQTLARHASPELTMNVYGHARQDRLADAVERVAEVVLPVKRVPVE
jgi:integrase